MVMTTSAALTTPRRVTRTPPSFPWPRRPETKGTPSQNFGAYALCFTKDRESYHLGKQMV